MSGGETQRDSTLHAPAGGPAGPNPRTLCLKPLSPWREAVWEGNTLLPRAKHLVTFVPSRTQGRLAVSISLRRVLSDPRKEVRAGPVLCTRKCVSTAGSRVLSG